MTNEILDIRSMASSTKDGRCLEVWFARNVTDDDRANLIAAVNALRAQSDVRAPAPQGEPVAWCGWHPERGYNFGTMAQIQQGATSRLMLAGVAGNHGWSVQPLYAAPPPPAAASPSGSRTARRDARVRRVHIAQGSYRLCDNKPRQDGDVIWTNGNLLGPTPSNTCKRCKRVYLR